MTNVQIRNVPDDVLELLRTEASNNGRSLQQHLLTVLDEHTTRARRRALFDIVDAALGEKPLSDEDPTELVRAERDELDARDASRAEARK